MTNAHELTAAYWAAADARDWKAFGALLADNVLYRGPQTREFDFARLRGLVEANGLYEPVADQTFAECPGLHLQTWRRSIKSPEREDRAASHVVEPSSPR